MNTLALANKNGAIVYAEAAGLPGPIREAGEQASRRYIEFFTAQIRNANTRRAYGRAATQFFSWCENYGLALEAVQPVHVAAYIETHSGSATSVKQHLAALRMLFDWLQLGQVIPDNPARSVRGPKVQIQTGKTPVLDLEEARALLASMNTEKLIDVRDRALMGIMVYTFARVSAVTNMTRGDYYPSGKRWKVRLEEKGGKRRELPVHHKAEDYIDAWLQSAQIEDKAAPLFQSIQYGRVTGRALAPRNVLDRIKKRCEVAGVANAEAFGSHSLRGTGITAFLEAGGALDVAQDIAGHADSRTTRLYDRRKQNVRLSEIERICL